MLGGYLLAITSPTRDEAMVVNYLHRECDDNCRRTYIGSDENCGRSSVNCWWWHCFISILDELESLSIYVSVHPSKWLIMQDIILLDKFPLPKWNSQYRYWWDLYHKYWWYLWSSMKRLGQDSWIGNHPGSLRLYTLTIYITYSLQEQQGDRRISWLWNKSVHVGIQSRFTPAQDGRHQHSVEEIYLMNMGT